MLICYKTAIRDSTQLSSVEIENKCQIRRREIKKNTQQRQWNEKNEIDRQDQNKRHDNTIKYFMKKKSVHGQENDERKQIQ